MLDDSYKQRIEHFVRERNIPKLIDEARTLITIYIGGDDEVDLESLVSALWVLQEISELLDLQKGSMFTDLLHSE